jgi:hypothetical protein
MRSRPRSSRSLRAQGSSFRRSRPGSDCRSMPEGEFHRVGQACKPPLRVGRYSPYEQKQPRSINENDGWARRCHQRTDRFMLSLSWMRFVERNVSSLCTNRSRPNGVTIFEGGSYEMHDL